MIPTKRFCRSTTGSRRTRCVPIVASTVRTSSSGRQEWTLPVDITWRTAMAAGAAERVVAAIQISRSVITPTTFWSSTTGTIPQSQSHMIWAAAARLVSGPHARTSEVCRSLTFMIVGRLSRGCVSHEYGCVVHVAESLTRRMNSGALCKPSAPAKAPHGRRTETGLLTRAAHRVGNDDAELLIGDIGPSGIRPSAPGAEALALEMAVWDPGRHVSAHVATGSRVGVRPVGLRPQETDRSNADTNPNPWFHAGTGSWGDGQATIRARRTAGAGVVLRARLRGKSHRKR